MRLAFLAACLMASGVLRQGDPGSVSGLIFDPSSGAFTAVEITLTGIDVRDTYMARTGVDGRYEFARLAPGSYRVAIRQPGIVPIENTLTVASGSRQTLDIRTALQARMTLGLSPASTIAFRKWIAGGPSPSQPLEWECMSGGKPCVAPMLLAQPPGEIIVTALAQLEGRSASVQIVGIITADGFLTGASVSAATSEEFAAAALAEVSRLRWEPARFKQMPAVTAAELDIRF